MSGPTRYNNGDHIHSTMVVGKRELEYFGAEELPATFPSGSLGQIVSDIGGKLDMYLQNKATNKTYRVLVPLGGRGKFEKFKHPYDWA